MKLLTVFGVLTVLLTADSAVKAQEKRFSFDLHAYRQLMQTPAAQPAVPPIHIDEQFDKNSWVSHGNSLNDRWPNDIDQLNAKLDSIVKEKQKVDDLHKAEHRFKSIYLAGYCQTYHNL